jgi:signal transduction histidine kinase
LDQLAQVERQLKPLLRPLTASAPPPQGEAVMTLIGDAIAEETAEAQAAQARAKALVKRLELIALIQGSVTLLLVVLLVVWIVRGLGQPLERLLSAMQALGAGDLGHRIGSTRTDEFGVLSQRFDLMASDLQANRLALDAAQQRLEDEVAARTDQLKSANARLSDIDANRRRFLADVSHELRTPLTVIRGEADVTLRGVDKPVDEYRSALVCVRDQAALLARLVDDLLFIARQESGDIRLRPQTIQIVPLVERLCLDFRSVVDRANLQFQFVADLPDAPSLVMTGDPDRLRQLFLILLDNAVRYSNPGGSITVTATRTVNGVRLAVRDTGIGIPAGDLERVFERRHRAANAVRHNAQGSGLGLPLARAIAEAHGGTVVLHSEASGGVTALVSLPAQHSTMKAIA